VCSKGPGLLPLQPPPSAAETPGREAVEQLAGGAVPLDAVCGGERSTSSRGREHARGEGGHEGKRGQDDQRHARHALHPAVQYLGSRSELVVGFEGGDLAMRPALSFFFLARSTRLSRGGGTSRAAQSTERLEPDRHSEDGGAGTLAPCRRWSAPGFRVVAALLILSASQERSGAALLVVSSSLGSGAWVERSQLPGAPATHPRRQAATWTGGILTPRGTHAEDQRGHPDLLGFRLRGGGMGGGGGKKQRRAGGGEPWKIPLNPVEDEGEDTVEAIERACARGEENEGRHDEGHAPHRAPAEKKIKEGKSPGAMKKRSAAEGSEEVGGGIQKKKKKKKKRTSVGEPGRAADADGFAAGASAGGLGTGGGRLMDGAGPGGEAGSEKGKEGGKRKSAASGGSDQSSAQKKQKKKLKGQGQGAPGSAGREGEAGVAEAGASVTVHAFPTDDADHAETPRVRSRKRKMTQCRHPICWEFDNMWRQARLAADL